MCLDIHYSQKDNKKELKTFIKNRKEIFVYKILQKWEDEDFYRSWIHYSFTWDFDNQKTFEADRPNQPTKEELEYGQIDIGIHVFINLEKAKNWREESDKIVKFRVKAEDIVAINNIHKEAVCRRLEFVKVV
jgi:hypothetical protein